MLEAQLVRVRNKYCPSAIEEVAEAADAGFQWPAEALHRDADVVRSEGSLLGAITSKIELHRHSRFNVERMDTMFSTDSKYPTLRIIAVLGRLMVHAADEKIWSRSSCGKEITPQLWRGQLRAR